MDNHGPISPNENKPQPTWNSDQPVVVGIGASAGGLAALKTFFEHVAPDSGLVYVVVVHLPAEHESHLADLLQFRSKMPVQQVTETTRLLPDRVFVIPPGYNLSAIDTHLRLSTLEGRRHERGPIDHFFRTLATAHDGHAIGVVLTGTGSDGTIGIREIKAGGGLVVVQDPNDAEYDGMPQSAIATGLADLVLPVSAIPSALQKLVKISPRVPIPDDGVEPDPQQRKLLQKIFALVRARTGRDYSHYKRSTSVRRIARRMQLNFIDDLDAYLNRLRDKPEEVRALSDDLLITVTNFFRDPKVFAALETDVIPRLFEGKQGEDGVRVWSVGCATGEEAYSLAMLLLEEAGRHEAAVPIQVFATDLHEGSLAKARDGYYSADIESEMQPERLRRFFLRQGEGYRIRKEVRDLIVFSQHNVLADPPFSRLDVIVCRNLLIYLQGKVQEDVIELFHYALKPDGYLVLGPSEVVKAGELFRPLDNAQKILQKRNVPAPATRLPVFPWKQQRMGPHGSTAVPNHEPVSYRGIHGRLLERYAPPSVLVSSDDKVVHLSDGAGRFLVLPGGDPTQNFIKLVRTELRIELLAALQAARVERRAVDSKPVRVQFDGDAAMVVMRVRPADESADEGFVLVIFEQLSPSWSETSADADAVGSLVSANDRRDLESQMEVMRQRLQSVIGQYETSQEEMKASNEELQSTNEELRSTLEELETSKEELQSMNEELQTVNQENRHKVEELGLLSSDLQNLLAATDIATLFLDREFRILRFTPKLSELFNVRTMDRGRPLSDITHRLGYGQLLSDAQQVLDSLIPIEREIQDIAAGWYLMRVRPYRSADERIEGIVVTFVDITSRKEAAQEIAVLGRLHRALFGMVAARGFESAAKAILDATVELLGAEMGNVQVLREGGAGLEMIAQRGFGPEFLEHFRLVAMDDDRPCARAARMRRRVTIHDVETDDAFASHVSIALQSGYRSVQSTPLIDSGGNVIGVLSTHFRDAYRLTEREERMLDVLAPAASVLLERVRAEDQLKQLADDLERRVEERTLSIQEKERQVRELAAQMVVAEQEERGRIAQVLHDNLQQVLFGIEIKMDLLSQEVLRASPALLGKAQEVHALLKRSIEMTRTLSIEMAPAGLEGDGDLRGALAWLVRQMQQLHNLSITLNSDGDLRVAKEAAVLVFGIVRELLFNIAKHAQTDHASLDVKRGGRMLQIDVRDGGVGFDLASLDDCQSYGMQHVRRHVALLNGALKIDSATGRGTGISIELDLESGAPQA